MLLYIYILGSLTVTDSFKFQLYLFRFADSNELEPFSCTNVFSKKTLVNVYYCCSLMQTSPTYTFIYYNKGKSFGIMLLFRDKGLLWHVCKGDPMQQEPQFDLWYNPVYRTARSFVMEFFIIVILQSS